MIVFFADPEDTFTYNKRTDTIVKVEVENLKDGKLVPKDLPSDEYLIVLAWKGITAVPAFQLDENGNLIRRVREINKILSQGFDEWGMVRWWFTFRPDERDIWRVPRTCLKARGRFAGPATRWLRSAARMSIESSKSRQKGHMES